MCQHCMHTLNNETFFFLWQTGQCKVCEMRFCTCTGGKTRVSVRKTNQPTLSSKHTFHQWYYTSTKKIWKSLSWPFFFFLLWAKPQHQMLTHHWWRHQNHHGFIVLTLVLSLFQHGLLFHLAGRSFTSFPESCCPSQVWLGLDWSQTGSKCVSVVVSMCVCVCTVG